MVDRTADLDSNGNFIGYAKLMNAGQTCIAPDYAIVPEEVRTAFAKIGAHLRRMFGTEANNKDYTSTACVRPCRSRPAGR